MKSLGKSLSVALFSLLSGCFYVGPPFTASSQFSGVPDTETVIVGVTHVTLGSNAEGNGVFWEHTQRVIESLPGQAGYLGHKVRKRLFVNEAWTMTIWENEDAINAFVAGERHRDAMSIGLPAVKHARFLRLPMLRSQTPPDWKTIEQLMATNGRRLY